MAVKLIPEGFHSVTPQISVRGAAKLIDFTKQAFDAREVNRMPGPGGTVMHAEVEIGNSRMMISDVMDREPVTGSFYLYVDDVDSTYKRALQAGAQSTVEPTDMFWGDRHGQVKDQFGILWSIATHKEDVPEGEMAKRIEAMMRQQK